MSVVVGVSPKTGSPNALRFAAEEARRRGTDLRAVTAWRPSNPPMTSGARPPATHYDPQSEFEDAVSRLQSQVRDALGDETGVRAEVLHGGKVRVLLQAAETADLLVLDAPRRPRLGPVLAHRLTYVAECPVVTMPTEPR
jgi:nucleotide-binding universal stress UspA family protein